MYSKAPNAHINQAVVNGGAAAAPAGAVGFAGSMKFKTGFGFEENEKYRRD
jgi:hypothetical protein